MRRCSALVAAGLAVVVAVVLTACSADRPHRPSSSVSPRSPGAVAAPAAEAPVAAAAPSRVVRHRARPRPAVNHCAHNTVAQQVLVSIRAQHMWLCARHRTVETNPITSGMVGQWTSTPTGNYWIQGRNRDTTLTLNTGATYPVRYWIPFDAPLFGFHDASWQNFPFGSAKYKAQGSHGCIHMPLRAIGFLYRWAAAPTAVHIAA